MNAIANINDVGKKFSFNNENFEIIKFKPKATKYPFIVKNIDTVENFLIPITNYILDQIKKGKVIEIK